MAWTAPSTYVAGAILTAASLNTNVRDNSLAGGPIYATTAARDAAIPTPFAGQRAFVSGTNVNYQYNGTAWVSPQALLVPPSVSVYYGTTSTYTDNTNIVWTAADYNTDTMWTSGATVTVKTAGMYLVTFTGRATSTVTATYNAVLFLGSTGGYEVQQTYASTADGRWSSSAVRSLAVNDTILARIQMQGTITFQGATSIRPTLTATFLGKIA